jgi:hypothetical protein
VTGYGRARIRKLVPSSFLVVFVCSLLVGCRNYFLPYPFPWDHSKDKPNASDMAGIYKILKLRLPSTVSGFDKDARIILKTDGTAVLSSFPEFDDSGQKFVCSLSGTATWALQDDRGFGWSLEFQNYEPVTNPIRRECELENSVFDGIQVLSRHAPYRLYEYVGDPDSDTGIEFERADSK